MSTISKNSNSIVKEIVNVTQKTPNFPARHWPLLFPLPSPPCLGPGEMHCASAATAALHLGGAIFKCPEGGRGHMQGPVPEEDDEDNVEGTTQPIETRSLLAQSQTCLPQEIIVLLTTSTTSLHPCLERVSTKAIRPDESFSIPDERTAFGCSLAKP